MPEYWTNTVTLYVRTGGSYVRAGIFEGCFWARRDSYVYDNGHRFTRNSFICRIPYAAAAEPGDILVLGDTSALITDSAAFLKAHAGDAFRVSKASALEGSLYHQKCEGTNP